MPRVLVDIGPLRRYPQFRRLWIGYILRQVGAQLTVATVIYQLFLITHSNFDIGLLSLVQLGPSIVAPIIGGAIVDAIDRRLMLVGMALLIAGCTAGLAINAQGGHPALWPLFVLSGAIWGFTGIDSPTRQAVTIALVSREDVVGANILRQLTGQFSNIAGPGLAGVLIFLLHQNFSIIYWLDVASSIAALQAVLRLPPLLPSGGGTRFGISSIAEGFRFLKSRQVIKACFIADLNATILGQPTSLFPYMALVHFHGGSRAFGLLSAAPAMGACFGSFFSGWAVRVRRQGRAVLTAIVIWGFATAAFGFAPWLWLGVVAVAIAGWADATSALFRSSILQLEVPDRLRGRLSALQSTVVQSGPRLGNAEGGFVAALSTAPIAIITGGLGCVIGVGLLAWRIPSFAKYDINSATGEEDVVEGLVGES